MRRILIGLLLCVLTATAASAQGLRKCGFGFWSEGERCRGKNGIICERTRVHGYGSALKQFKCWRSGKKRTRKVRRSKSKPHRRQAVRKKANPRRKTNRQKRQSALLTKFPKIYQRVVPTGVKRRILHFYNLDRKCRHNGDTVIRITSKPINGKLSTEQGRVFPSYHPSKPRSKCNDKEVPAATLWYQSNTGFKGNDLASIEVIFSNGMYARTKLEIAVK